MRQHRGVGNRKNRRSVKHRLREQIPSRPPLSPPPEPTGRTVLVESSHAERRRLAKAIATSSDSTPISGDH
jgi:hypothetical protein